MNASGIGGWVGKVRDGFAPSASGLTSGFNGSNSEAGEADLLRLTPV